MEVKFSNFKGFGGEHSLDIAPLTLVYGANSSGKSSLLELLRRYWDTRSTRPIRAEVGRTGLSLAHRGKRANKIGMRRMVPEYGQHLTYSLTLAVETEWAYSADCDEFHPHRIKFETAYGSFTGRGQPETHQEIQGLEVPRFGFLLDRVAVRRVVESALRGAIGVPLDTESEDWFVEATTSLLHPLSDFWDLLTNPDETGFEPFPEPLSPEATLAMVLPALRSSSTEIRVTEDAFPVVGDFDNQVGALLEWLIGGLFESPAYEHDHALRSTWWGWGGSSVHIPAIRPPIPADYQLDDGTSVKRFDATSPESYIQWLSSRPPRKGEAPEFEDRLYERPGLPAINYAFDQLGIPHHLGLTGSCEYDEDGRTVAGTKKAHVYFEDSRTGVKVKPTEVGSGIAQVLPLVAAVELLRDQVLLTVEQPELHLHPQLQARLGEYLVGRVERFHSDVDPIIVETHSELLILRVLRLIREGTVSPSTVAVYYVGDTSEGPEITRMRIGADGEFIDEWPAGFFEERLDELF